MILIGQRYDGLHQTVFVKQEKDLFIYAILKFIHTFIS
ncbi:hypothetical protein SAMN05421768_101529 [Chryseobacterium joostei]|uniref:Uncharacterized protein n=1 Tax=Chryseobacterium joostei TaxID=112234 RepID=A0A1N7HWU5_9FLAO|nr:hypothetical protein SAMN05421768_101529 [Chryseobacterium joostei]